MSDLDLDAIRRRLERAEATGSWAFWRQVGDFVPALLAEVERLRANQLPDGGFWDVEYFEPTGMGFVEAESKPTYQRRVWTGPVTPIPSQSDSAGLDTPDPHTTRGMP